MQFEGKTHTPEEALKLSKEFDELIEDTLERILLPSGTHLSLDAKRQARLPLAQGGLGLTATVDSNAAAWISAAK